jgi:trigger factor
MAQSDIKITLRTWKRSLQKTSEHKWHNTGQILLTKEVQGIVARFVKPRRSEKKLSDQVVAEKLLELFKEKVNN